MIELATTVILQALKWIIEAKTKKKLSEQGFIAYLDAHRKKTSRVAESTDEFEDEINKL